jgi:UDP-N-acetylmuramyl pentapeptide phosphotransferase/UDP-N-acetylglucosamine-1-phosphate transferase
VVPLLSGQGGALALAAAALLLGGLAAVASGRATAAVEARLRRASLMDRPNARSSHKAPVPRGGGLAVVSVLAAGWAALAALSVAPEGTGLVLLGTALVAAVSWADDVRGLGVGVRLAAQVVAVGLGLAALPEHGILLAAAEPHTAAWALERLLLGLAWLWFVNAYNFMDGIDGITGVQTAAIGAGIAVAVLAAGGDAPIVVLGAVAAGVGVGFLRRNWHPASIFLGDVGSVPLGYTLGWLLLLLAGRGPGGLAAAMILPLYYVADATLTLLRRIARGERPWEAHREHFYQIAALRLGRHDAVVAQVFLLDAALIVLAALAAARPAWAPTALVVATASTAAVLLRLSGGVGRHARS